MSELNKLQVAKHALNLMVAGIKVMKVGKIAEQVDAPSKKMNAKSLMNWVSDKILILSLLSEVKN